MKIQFVSDLHLEMYPNVDIPTLGDVLVLAGDISYGDLSLEFASKYCDKFEAVIVIAGNHEFYGSEYGKTLDEMLEYGGPSSLFFLHNDWITINGINFYGSTLWSDLSNYHDAMIANQIINDYHVIRYKDIKDNTLTLSPKITTQFYYEALKLLTNYLKNTTRKTVVITHHLPHIYCVHDRFLGSKINRAYYSDTIPFLHGEGLTKNIALWIHGHTHDSHDFLCDEGIRIVCNPRGYGNENTEFNPIKVVEVL